MDIIINQSHTFELSLTNNQGDFTTSGTVTIEIRDTGTDALEASGTMTVQGDVYKFSHTFTSLGQFRVLYTTPMNFQNVLETIEIIDSVPDQVWDENLGDHQLTSSTGQGLSDASTIADVSGIADAVWESNQSGIGRQLTEGTKDTEIDAIKAKTDNLPSDPSSETNATSNTNSILSAISSIPSDVWSFTTRTLTGFGTLISDIWSFVTRELTGIGTSGITSETNATTNKNQVISEIDDNETKIDSLPTASDNADATWDETLADHLSAGSTGEALDNADATADPQAVADAVWESNQTGIGRQLTEGTKDSEIDAIKAKTDNLPSDPASESNATTNKNDIITEIDANELKIDSIDSDLNAHRTATEDKIKFILGLSQHNTRIDSQVYDEADLTSAKIKLYDNATDAQNDTNIAKEYQMTATYDTEGKLTNYLVKEL